MTDCDSRTLAHNGHSAGADGGEADLHKGAPSIARGENLNLPPETSGDFANDGQTQTTAGASGGGEAEEAFEDAFPKLDRNAGPGVTDGLADRRARRSGKAAGTAFHKMNLTRREFAALFERAGFVVESVSPVENMPILYKFAFFRARTHKVFDENRARAEGYRLSGLGQLLQNALMRWLPDQFCNIYVLIARRP